MNYREAKALLDGEGKRRGPRNTLKVARNTYLERGSDFLPAIRDAVPAGTKWRRGYHSTGYCTMYDAVGDGREYPDNAIGLRYYQTYVVIFTPHWTELNSGGWHTMSTRDRIQMSNVRLGSKKGMGWTVLLRWDNGYPFFDGVRVNPDATRLLVTQPHRPSNWEPIYTESGYDMIPRWY